MEDEVKLRDPKHTRRVKLLQTKRGSDSHSDFLERLKEKYCVAEFEKMSGDESMIHLFIQEAYAQMARIATEILERENRSIYMLVNKIKETEVAGWYNHNKEFGRMANMRAPKFCKPCYSKTHNESECWGPCEICGQRNHQSKYCRYKNAQA